MRYIIIGAGAVGGAIGGRLFESGHQVVLVARGTHYKALAAHGLRLATPDAVLNLPVPTVDGPEGVELRPDDVLVLAVKTQDTAVALASWADRPVLGGGTAGTLLPLVCAQNGVENERLALRQFQHVYGMSVWLPATHLEPGAVAAAGAPLTGILTLGRYPRGLDDTARRISADLEGSRLAAPLSEDVMRWKYGKLLTNLGNAVEALLGRDGDPEAVARATELNLAARAEGEQVLTAAGIAFSSDQDRSDAAAGRLRLRPIAGVRREGGSSWQSLVRGTGSIEADYLNGEIVLIGRHFGIPTPVNATLQRLANHAARHRLPPGSLTPAELAADLAAAVAAAVAAAG